MRPPQRNIKLVIEYDGANYSGWQRQKNTPRTIQETIEKILRKIIGEKIILIASGRTDAGVHATGQVANFKTISKIPAGNIKKALNGLLPKDISIRDVEEVFLNFHSRFSAKSKAYRYSILNQEHPSALLRDYCYFMPHKLDIVKMRKAAKGFLGRHDFSAFCASGSSVKGTVRTIKKISVTKKSFYPLSPISYPLIFIDITADGFLYNMARSIAGTLISVSRGKIKPRQIKEIIKGKLRKSAGPTLPAHGLCLLKVGY